METLNIWKPLSGSANKLVPSLTNEWSPNIGLDCFTFVLFVNTNKNINQHSFQNYISLSTATKMIGWYGYKSLAKIIENILWASTDYMEFTVKNLAYFYFQVVIYILFISKIYN